MTGSAGEDFRGVEEGGEGKVLRSALNHLLELSPALKRRGAVVGVYKGVRVG